MPPLPGLYPADRPRPTSSRAERLIWERLRTELPDGWTCWHSLKVRTLHGREGEGDFTFFIPGRGVLVLEVKGGRVEVVRGQWMQSGNPMREAPRAQAHQFVKKLLDALREQHFGAEAWCSIATCFPETPFDAPPTQGDLVDSVLGAHDLPHLKERLEHFAKTHFIDKAAPRGDVPSALHALWGETWVPRVSLGAEAEQRQQAFVELDAAQCGVLDALRRNQRVAVVGGPGTGKTFVASELARRWLEAGKRPLYLCSTESLARKLRDRWQLGVAEGREQPLLIETVRRHAAALIRRGGQVVQEGEPEDTWTPATWDTVPSIAAELAASGGTGAVDAILVDEAQDMTASDWSYIEALATGRQLWIFGDDEQGFWEERRLPTEGFVIATLDQRYRVPEPLARFADLYRAPPASNEAGGPRPEVEPLDLDPATVALPEGLEGALELLSIASPRERLAGLEACLALLLDEQGVAPHDVAILSLGGQTQSAIAHLDTIGSYPVRRGDAEDASEHVICDTFLRFKGLERPFIVLVELDRARTRYAVRMHISLTRAQLRCFILATPAEIARDGILRALSG